MISTDANRPIYLFVHIPKTAGKSLSAHLRMNIENFPERVIQSTAVDIETDDTLKAMSQEQLRKTDLFVGHGVSARSAKYFEGREPRFFTVLRDPTDLAISQYNWVHRDPAATVKPFDSWFNPAQRNRMSTWLARRYGENTRDNAPMSWHENGRLYQLSKDKLSQFFCVGVQSNLEKSLEKLFDALEIPSTIAKSKNVSGQDIPKRMTRTPQIEAIVKDLCKDDYRLFQDYDQSN